MSNPVLVELLRGPLVESSHCGALAVVDADGTMALALGDVERPVFPRSAVKALQALPLVETGAADRYGLDDEELAVACASHGGEPGHVAAVTRMLERAGLDLSALCCGAHWPLHQPSAQVLTRSGSSASALHNNCSGKHAGFLCVACAIGAGHRNYVEPDHPVQREVRATLAELTEATLGRPAVDGCSVPTWAISLRALALGFARFGTGQGLSLLRAKAAARLREACAAKPWHVAGTARFCTELMQTVGARAFVKIGAEGMFCGALPEQGLGFAIKCDDGAGRAAEVIAAALVARFGTWNGHEQVVLERFMRPTLRNWNGIVVGGLRPAEALAS
jgi:L-asparaginase II